MGHQIQHVEESTLSMHMPWVLDTLVNKRTTQSMADRTGL